MTMLMMISVMMVMIMMILVLYSIGEGSDSKIDDVRDKAKALHCELESGSSTK